MLSEKDSLLASQAAELEALRAQLGSPSPADDNQVVVGKEEYAKLVALSDETMQTLAEKDSVLRAREQELEELRVRLETERNEVAAITAGDLPTIIVSEQEDTVKGLKEQVRINVPSLLMRYLSLYAGFFVLPPSFHCGVLYTSLKFVSVTYWFYCYFFFFFFPFGHGERERGGGKGGRGGEECSGGAGDRWQEILCLPYLR